MVHTVHLTVVLMSVRDNELVVLINNNRLPSQPHAEGQNLDSALKTFVSYVLPNTSPYVEQLFTTDDPVEIGSILVVYFALLPYEQIPSQLKKSMRSVHALPGGFIEKNIVNYATQRLRWKVEYTNVVYNLLPKEFTLSELQHIYEAILGRLLDKRNFRKKFLSLSMVKDTGKKKIFGRARPASVYVFKKREVSIIEIL
jgi:8-oxo-dGTP diphosphatase